MMLASVLAQSSADATGDGTAVDGDPDALVGYAAQVVDLGRLEREEPELGPPVVPPVDDRLRDRRMS